MLEKFYGLHLFHIIFYQIKNLAKLEKPLVDRVARMRFDFEISDPTHLNRLMYVVREIDSVYDVYRVVPGGDEQQILSSSDN